jgi:hypothetical protein
MSVGLNTMRVAASSEGTLADNVARRLADSAARQDPHPLFDRVREHEPVHYCEAASSWVVARYADAGLEPGPPGDYQQMSSGRALTSLRVRWQ